MIVGLGNDLIRVSRIERVLLPAAAADAAASPSADDEPRRDVVVC